MSDQRPVSESTVTSEPTETAQTPGGSADPPLPYADRPVATAPGHWVLARAGKRVLRPGGAALSTAMLGRARLAGADVVELAPGLGRTAAEVIAAGPASYTAIDRDPDAARRVAADVVIGEAMLTMQSDKGKAAIAAEAARVLRPGGRYAIHELGVTPDDIDDAYYAELRKDLARAIHVNARPMTAAAWKQLLQDAGLVVDWVGTAPMALMKFGRNLRDEGMGGFARIVRNVIRDKELRQRMMLMRRTFKRYGKDMVGIALVAHKPE
ncbi:SAM-dependent methyltransferase [Actinomyces sp. MRS3W]|uniref:SAM-dependent methyltransferase n=1 Tax=Actinomyces sp. MRS3W TaxID=2800796 RepID=UPI0028FD7823|nr:SAM-dependent methyltransferase [Actinomyces sp. MRS3W]MDU0348997.1 SAM-dependent methyltransferase [Actinomyces sp. MRS3W]